LNERADKVSLVGMARAFTSIFLLYLLLTLVGCPSSPSPATDAVVEDAYVDAFSPSDVEIDVVDTSSPQDTSTPDIVVDVVSDSTVPTDTFDTTPPVDIITPPSCADGDKCTIDVWDDEAGECIYYSVNCDDGTPCTIDNCIPESGCEFVWQDDEGCCL